MGGSGTFTASPLTSVFGSEGGGSGTEGRGRPANLSAPSGGRGSVGWMFDGSGPGRGTATGDGRTATLALPGLAAALGSSETVFEAGVVPRGAGSALRSLSSLTRSLAAHHTSDGLSLEASHDLRGQVTVRASRRLLRGHAFGRLLVRGAEPVRRRPQTGHSQSTDIEPSDRVATTIRQPRSASVPAVRTLGAGESQPMQTSRASFCFDPMRLIAPVTINRTISARGHPTAETRATSEREVERLVLRR